MNILSNIPKQDMKNFRKIYEGEFIYKKEKTIFSGENFEVFRNKEKLSIMYSSEVFSRTLEGIVYDAKINYLISKEFIPQFVSIEKKLGKDYSAEVFDFIEKDSIIEYQFINSSSKEKKEIKSPTKFHIATPAAVCSHSFLLTKKFDTSHLNYYQVLKSNNKWNFEETPSFIEIGSRKESEGVRNLKIGAHKLKSTNFISFMVESGESGKSHLAKSGISVKVSPYHGIPYLIEDLDGSTVEIKTLKNLLSEET
jgi:hypothetical protein